VNIDTLRKTLSNKRQQLSQDARQLATTQSFQQLNNSQPFLNSQHIGFYHPVHGEVDPQDLLDNAWELGKKCYLPVLSPSDENHLEFIAYKPGDILQKNKFSIPEPELIQQNIINPIELDLVFVPLVIFDEQCHRVGMGKGYYDRTFSFKQDTKVIKPILIGLAYEFQKVAKLDPEPWDVQLDCVVTESHIYQKSS